MIRYYYRYVLSAFALNKGRNIHEISLLLAMSLAQHDAVSKAALLTKVAVLDFRPRRQ